ncbi:hypothetical protein BGW39_009362 [Mortierella sp. 14UC]|nr:hypothetical protein BGW39_009362 [Mortierella sp. 14UC]
MFTPSSTQHHHHQLQILGNHPASPVACTFLDLPEDPFMPTRANLLFDSEYRQESQEPIYENDAFMPYGTTASATSVANSAENEYIYSQPTTSSSSYVMPMSRTFSDSQLSDMCESSSSPFDSHAAAAALAGQAGLNHATGTAMCQSPLGYNSQVVYNDDYYASAHQHNLYSQQHSQSHHPSHGHSHHQHQNHSYSTSTSSLSSISEDSASLSPRSPFSSHGSMSMSSSCNSLSSYPLSRTLSESSVPFFQALGGNNSMSSVDGGNNNHSGGVTGSNGTSLVKPTPKRSRGRRVSCNPDNSGCKVFTCRFEDCGKIFKRSEHLKRHVRSIHTMEKPFECPIANCPKRFSRSDNLNQHIRIHRHNGRGEKNKTFNAFTPFFQNYPNELFSS